MYHIIQENCFREPHYDRLIEAIKRLELDYEVIKLRPFIDEIDFTTDRKDVMVWGAIKLARLALKENWIPGSFMSDKHDYDHYKDRYRSFLFNYDSTIIKYSDKKSILPEQFFARPTKDTKSFTGKIFTKEEFNFMRGTIERNNWVKEDFNIQIAPIKKIQSEGRFWVVGGEVITGSLYRRGNKYFLEEIKRDDPMWDFAQAMVVHHQIADAFVIDICMSNNSPRIMELGCINCAGFYLGDMQKVIIALEDKYK